MAALRLKHGSGTQRASLVAQLVKNLAAMKETGVRSLDWEDPLEKGTATVLLTVTALIFDVVSQTE